MTLSLREKTGPSKSISRRFARKGARAVTYSIVCAGALTLSGCKGINSATDGVSVSTASGVPSQNFPTPPTPTVTNMYLGTQNPGLWSLTLDDQNDLFSYQALTYPANPNVATSGYTAHVSGFTELLLSNAQPAGYALEIPSRAVLLRPGDVTTNLIFAVQQTTCYPLSGNVRLQSVLLGNVAGILTFVGNGSYSVAAGTNSTGTAWQFSDAVGGYQGPASFSGTCAINGGQAGISIPASATQPLPATFIVGETGFQFEEFGVVSGSSQPNSPLGFAQPTSPLSATGIAAGTYLGFIYSQVDFAPAFTTQLLSLGSTAVGSKTLSGGLFPNDDASQAPGAGYSLSLGTQDPANNGVFPSAAITFPDPSQQCSSTSGLGTPGVDASGNPNCTTKASAIVGSAEGQYAIIARSTQNATLSLYLFQQ